MPKTRRKYNRYMDYPRFAVFLLLCGLLAGAAWRYRTATDDQVGYKIRQSYYEITRQVAGLRALLPGA
jgi:hypothetical protein